MQTEEIVLHRPPTTLSLTLRDYVVMGFRHGRSFVTSFAAVLLACVLWAIIFPHYRAETEILVRRERVDPVVTPEQVSPMMVSNLVSEEELNSEVELIRSEDVLRKVVLQCGLDNQNKSWFFRRPDPQRRTALAIRSLNSSLSVEAIPKTNIIRVSYTSRKPQVAANVLKTLEQAYLEKHKEVHRPTGQFAFFDSEAQKVKSVLDDAEAKLRAFSQQSGVANPTLARDITLQRVNEFNASLGQTRAAIADTQRRISTLKQLASTTPARLTTQMRQADDAPVLQQMKSTLLTLELKRSDMASKFQPSYPPLQELEREIAQTRAAIDGERQLTDNTTDQNPAYVWINSELVKAKAELSGAEARAARIEAIIRQTMASARQLEVQGIEQQDLMRGAKAAEENYMLYLHKREEARISDALDQTHILNVAVAEKPTVPLLPVHSPLSMALLGTVLAFSISTGLVFAREYLDSSFRTPHEVETVLNLPVLAAIPQQVRSRYDLPSGN